MGKYFVVIVSIIFTIINIILYLILYNRYMSKKINKSEIFKGKTILFRGYSTYFMERESVGGNLILTEDELIFLSHKYKINDNRILISLLDIIKVNPISTMGIIPNGILLFTNDKEYYFTVYKRKQWLIKINKLLENTKLY